ncbi:hypothetical protein HJC23_012995 [Cyclotella cryptica]|uniref:Uncharacterized protein n=1 Tax=Cyclotella cryptica TaxID=29204 RepID=A0ABD3QG22_9STRA|eukprot:CCRYP_005598-RA/>CCRYP_005598-RA protein AED:0.38 eAED:0.38 QI:0/-1/0/1/-1/1/1/0/226
MGVQKVFQYHGDPFLKDVVFGLEKNVNPELEIKNDDTTTKGTRGLGERHLGNGDPLFKETERYHQAENDHFATPANTVALHESLFKSNKHNSLRAHYAGSSYDPILREYASPKTTLGELKALEADMDNKRRLFREMCARKRHNLDEQELYCDPLVNSYRIKELMFRGTKRSLKAAMDAEMSKYRKRMLAAAKFYPAEEAFPPVACTYRKLNAGDDLFDAAMEYHTK